VEICLTKALRARPLNNLRSGVLVLEGRIVGSESSAVNLDASEMAVSLDGGGESSEERSDLDLGRHFECMDWVFG
jgi:hypothetical protein